VTVGGGIDMAIVKFAVATCQDFRGRYYNAWQRLSQLDEELDFVIFLGDYIYETVTGPTETRSVQFSDPASALPLPGGNAAAQSVRTTAISTRRTVPTNFLKAVHEALPVRYRLGRPRVFGRLLGREQHVHRRNRRWADARSPSQRGASVLRAHAARSGRGSGARRRSGPGVPDTRIYRDLGFGKNLRLLVADCRTYRPDHLIPEDAYPGKVVVPQDALAALQLDGVFTSDTFAYVNIDEYGVEKVLLQLAYRQLAVAAGLDEAAAQIRAQAAVKGNLALVYVNAVSRIPQSARRRSRPWENREGSRSSTWASAISSASRGRATWWSRTPSTCTPRTKTS